MSWPELVLILALVFFPDRPPGWERWRERYNPLWLTLLTRAVPWARGLWASGEGLATGDGGGAPETPPVTEMRGES